MRLLLPAALAIIAASAGPALACSCARGPDAPMPPFVVRAKVIAVKPGQADTHARLRVLRTIRGKAPRNVVVRTPTSSAACGVTFRTGEVRLVGFSVHDGMYSANLCQQIRLDPAR